MPENEPQVVQESKVITGKTVMSFTLPTPMWAKMVFRFEFLLNKAILMVLSASSLFTAQEVKESLIWIAAFDFIVWGMAKGVGVKKQDFED